MYSSYYTVYFDVFVQIGLSEQCITRSDAAKRGVWSGSTLFATLPMVFDIHVTSSSDDLFKF